MKRLLTLAAGLMVGVFVAYAAQAESFDHESYGAWTERNMGMADGVYRYRQHWGEYDHSFNSFVQHAHGSFNEFKSATFRGGVYGLDQDNRRESGRVTITFEQATEGPAFRADFTGINALMDINAYDSQHPDYANRNWDYSYSEGTVHRQGSGHNWHLNGAVSFSRDTEPYMWMNGRMYGKWESGNTSLSGAFYEHGNAVAGTIIGTKSESGFDSRGDYFNRDSTFDGVFRARN